MQSASIVLVIQGQPKESLYLRVPPELKRQVEGYAEARGISVNAAASVLLAEALRAVRERGG